MPEQDLPKTLGQLLKQLDAEGVTDYRRYQAVRRYLDAKARKKGIPLSGTFELTPLCNLDCKMCYVHLSKQQLKGASLLTVAQWKSIIDQAVSAGMMYARLTGGECLTYPGFREIYLYLRSLGVETAILSNGILMDEDMVAFLKANRPSAIQITLYGASEEGYERVTGHRRFGTVMENIRRLKDAGIPLSVVTTPNEFMTDGEEIVKLLHELGMPIQINAGLIKPQEGTGRGLHDSDLDTYIAMLRLRKQLRGEVLNEVLSPEELPDVGGADGAAFGVRCGAGMSCFAVDWRGGMKPCNCFPTAPQQVLDMGFAEAWRRTHDTAVHFPRPMECEGCQYYGVCKHCVAEHAAGAPCGHANPNICAFGQRMVAEGLLKLSSL